MTEHHKQWVGRVFDSAASQYGEGSSSFFNFFGKQLVQHVPVAAKWHALDIATGRGAVLFPLAEKVGPSGKVVGIDISKQMWDTLVKNEIKSLSDTTSLAITPLWSVRALQNALEMAEFKNIKIQEDTLEWKSLWTHGTRAKFEQLTPQQLSALQENVMNKVKAQKKGLSEELQVFYGIARK